MKYPKHDSKSMEMHEEKPKGKYMPDKVWKMYDDTDKQANRLSPRILNAEEMMLLAKINALCDKKDGCWASNRWLGKWWGKSPHWVSETVSKFRKLNLVEIRTQTVGKRIIRRIWTTYEDDPPTHKEKPHPVRKTTHPPVRKTTHTNDTSYHRKKDDCDAGASGVPGLVFNNGNTFSKYVERFANFTIKHSLHLGKRGSTKTGWKSHILKDWDSVCRELRSQMDDPQELKTVMKWYFEHWRDEFVPTCHTLRSFCEKFVDVKKAMERQFQQQSKKGNDGEVPVERIYISRDGKRQKVTEWRTPDVAAILPKELYL